MARGNFGERLKRERELREVTLEEITSATRIGPRFLEALENEEWEKLPGGVFNRGFVRSVARYGTRRGKFPCGIRSGPRSHRIQPRAGAFGKSLFFTAQVDSFALSRFWFLFWAP